MNLKLADLFYLVALSCFAAFVVLGELAFQFLCVKVLADLSCILTLPWWYWGISEAVFVCIPVFFLLGWIASVPMSGPPKP
jgi:hypothetical protein